MFAWLLLPFHHVELWFWQPQTPAVSATNVKAGMQTPALSTWIHLLPRLSLFPGRCRCFLSIRSQAPCCRTLPLPQHGQQFEPASRLFPHRLFEVGSVGSLISSRDARPALSFAHRHIWQEKHGSESTQSTVEYLGFLPV